MADDVRKFKFISPGVFVNEIDQSELPATPGAIGPLLIGSAQSGPLMRPITVNSFNDFVTIFGSPLPGGVGGDVWRNGNKTAPTYAPYAAQAYLDTLGGPLTFIRAGGLQSTSATAAGYAGWQGGSLSATDSEGGAWGLVVFPSSSVDETAGVDATSVLITDGTPVNPADTGKELIFTNWDATTHTITLTNGGATTATTVEISLIGNPNDFATQLKASLDAAVVATTFKGTVAAIVDDSNGNPRLISLTSSAPADQEASGNQDITGDLLSAGGDELKVNPAGNDGTAASGDEAFTGGVSTQFVSPVTGALAGVVYCSSGRVLLSGTLPANTSVISASACELVESDANGNLQMVVSSDGTDAAGKIHTVKFNFDPSSKNFIRSVLNTDPTVTNSTITDTDTRTSNQGGNYWLGETYENLLAQNSLTSMGVLGRFDDSATILNTKFLAAVLPLENHAATTQQLNDRQYAAQKATTGWFISQDTNVDHTAYVSTNMKKLFRFEALDAGESVQRKVKVSISSIKYPQGDFEEYGSFSILVRTLSDSDSRMDILERFDQVNLNPSSANYIERIVGDKYVEYSESQERLIEYGKYPNQSAYIRVVVSDAVAAGGEDASLIPFGVYGPVSYRPFSVISGSGAPTQFGSYLNVSTSFGATTAPAVMTMLAGGGTDRFGTLGGSTLSGAPCAGLINLTSDPASAPNMSFSGSVLFPGVPLRKQNTWGSPKNLRSTFWGAWTGKSTSNVNFNNAIIDMVRNQASGVQGNQTATTLSVAVSGNLVDALSSPLATSWVFSLDDIVSVDGVSYNYISGSRADGTSLSAASGSYTYSIDAGLDRFTAVMFGGTDGLNLTEKNAFRNALMDDKTETTSYELYSLKSAINMVADVDDYQYNIISVPGVTQPLVTDHLIDMVEDRADALALIDIPNIYMPASDSNATEQTRRNYTVAQMISNLRGRNLNNSYAATYSPWVMIRDTRTNRLVWVPPTVPALGALATTDKTSAPWFAPAGFNRGGLSDGDGGLPVLDVSKKLNADDRDDLYEVNINPIAKFPAEGIVIFGQKTLQQTASALDRINVRRLMIYLKREISFIASRLLFEQNVPSTWANFTSQALPILDSVRAQFGITDFKLVLDESTTTPDLVDRNIIYAKLFIKPARSVEYFAIDFIVTRSGASFED
jgi:hypothetical protein